MNPDDPDGHDAIDMWMHEHRLPSVPEAPVEVWRLPDGSRVSMSEPDYDPDTGRWLDGGAK